MPEEQQSTAQQEPPSEEPRIFKKFKKISDAYLSPVVIAGEGSYTWEYRCVKFPFPDDFSLSLPFKQQYLDLPGKHTDLLNELGAEGWEWFHTDRDLFYFRRVKSGLTLEEAAMAAVIKEMGK